MENMTMFDRIKMVCKQNNTTIASVILQATGSNVGTYNTWRKRGVYPRVDDCVSIAKVLNVSLEWLITGKGIKRMDRYNQVAEKIDKLSDEQFSLLEAYINVIPVPEEKGTRIAE